MLNSKGQEAMLELVAAAVDWLPAIADSRRGVYSWPAHRPLEAIDAKDGGSDRTLKSMHALRTLRR